MATTQQKPQKAIAKKDVQKKGTFPQRIGPIVINYPMLWLALIALIVYVRTIWFGFTELDDSIFIRDFHSYNENLLNLLNSFNRGLFDAVKDPYYRPLFLDSMIINNAFFDVNIAGYHLVNILLHVGSVLLLYQVFIRLRVNNFHAFLLTIIFAVHPVLTQAVAWIPGRNDTMLAICAFAFFIFAIDYTNRGDVKHFLLSALFLLLGFFTKETAIFLPIVAFVMLVFLLQKNWLGKQNILLYVSWIGCFAIWFAVRSQATNIKASQMNIGMMLNESIHRVPVIIQYLGKIFLPVNLSVFPTLKDTTYVYGCISVVLLVAAFYFSKNVNWRVVTGGIVIFLLFLIPALLVPNKLNEQTFEHRLYLPIIGILLLVSETFLFKKLTDENLMVFAVIASGLLMIVNFNHQNNFSDPHTFWTNAVTTSPNSAYANMMLGEREDNMEHSYELFKKAYKLNPNEKYINYFYGRMLQYKYKDSILASEPYLLAEKNNSGFAECDFLLAHVAMVKNDTAASINYLKSYLTANPGSKEANFNLVLMYLSRRQFGEAQHHIAHMKKTGVPVSPELIEQLNAAQTNTPRANTQQAQIQQHNDAKQDTLQKMNNAPMPNIHL